MGIYAIRVPDIGEGIAEVELVTWHVQPGDMVAEDQSIADVMTDKATVEIPSPVSGKVLALGSAVGDTIAVGSELVRLEVEGAGNLKENSAPAPVHKSQSAPVLVAKSEPPAPAPAQPVARAEAAPAPLRSGAVQRSAPAVVRAAGERPLASPAVRQRALEYGGWTLRYVHGSGPAGRILQGDLEAHAAIGGQAPTQGPCGLR